MRLGLGTATLHNDVCFEAVRGAIRAGYRQFDTALLYDNQEAVGEGIRQAIADGEVAREDLFVTSKIGFYPQKADGLSVKMWTCFLYIVCARYKYVGATCIPCV
jgi:diketogulonate reductase-like aldo/keto reductase